MAHHNQLGKLGEKKAVEYFVQLGCQIIACNWQEKKYEIDIIAQDKNEIVFVEVKTRSTDYFGSPEEAVDLKKQQHLIEGADYYIQQNEIDLEARFDVVAIVGDKLSHIKEAFYPEV